jgi:hypothetical protein
MLLSARPLKDVQSVNSFRYANQLQFTEGDVLTVYFQLVDASLDRADEGFNPAGRRYMPAAGAVLTVTVDSNNAAKKITRSATQPYVQDPSIWALSVLSTDTIRGTLPLKVSLNEAGKITNALVNNFFMIGPKA